MPRRKTLPPELRPAWEAFADQAERVGQASRALVACLPLGRVDPAPVPVGLDLLADELAAVEDELTAWQVEEVAAHWQACRGAVTESLHAIPHAREVAETTAELDELLEAVAAVVDPLEAWAEAERRWRALGAR